MKTTELSLSLFLLLFPAIAANAQMSLEECLRTGFARNTAYRQNGIEADNIRTELTASWLSMLPTVTATLDNELVWDGFPPFDDVSSVGVTGRITLFKGLSLLHERARAKTEYNLAPVWLKGRRQTLACSIIEAYIRILLDKEALNLARSNCTTSLLERDKTRLLVKGGAQPASALAQMEAQLAGDRATVTEAECRIKRDFLALLQLLDLPYRPEFDILPLDDESEEAPILPGEEEIRVAVGSNPETVYSEGMVKSSRYALKAAIGACSPEIFLTGTYSATIGAESYRNVSYMGIGISIPILSGGQHYSRVKKAGLALKAAELEAYTAAKNIGAEIERISVEVENSYSKLLSCRTSVESLEKLLEMNRAKYEKGASSVLDYTIAKNNLVKVRTELLEAKWQYIFQRKVLELYLNGKLLEYES